MLTIMWHPQPKQQHTHACFGVAVKREFEVYRKGNNLTTLMAVILMYNFHSPQATLYVAT